MVVQLTTDNYSGFGVGWTAAYSCDSGFKGTSSLNNTGNPIASNMLIVQTNAAGQFCVKSLRSTDLIVDLLGTVGGADLSAPGRAFDSRFAGGPATDRRIGVGPANTAMVLQVTTDNYANDGTGWTAVYNCDEGFKGTSSLNNKANPIASNTVIAQTDAAGAICIKSQYPSDHIVDVVGTISNAAASIHTPNRVFDSRTGSPPASTPEVVNVGIPNAVVVVQVTTDNYTSGTGWTAVYGCADGFHGTSSLNNTDNPVASNLVIVPTDGAGRICLQSLKPTDVIVDVIGTLTNSTIHTPNRILDTRTINPPTPPTPTPPTPPTPPPNPGDIKNCSDFATYAEAKAFFDTYFPYYGDIAKLDQNNDGIPCESLPGAPK